MSLSVHRLYVHSNIFTVCYDTGILLTLTLGLLNYRIENDFFS